MRNIKIIAIGKMGKDYLTSAQVDFSQRIRRLANLEIIEINEESISDESKEGLIEKALDKESEKIDGHLNNSWNIISLDINGKNLSTNQLAQYVKDKVDLGKADFTFIIGSSHGLAERIKKKSDLAWSFTRLTLPHQLARVLLLEQIYRILKINFNHQYHK